MAAAKKKVPKTAAEIVAIATTIVTDPVRITGLPGTPPNPYDSSALAIAHAKTIITAPQAINVYGNPEPNAHLGTPDFQLKASHEEYDRFTRGFDRATHAKERAW